MSSVESLRDTANGGDPRAQGAPGGDQPWYVRAAIRFESGFRPYLGWGVLLVLVLLSTMPAFTLRTNHWVELGRNQAVLEMMGPLSVLTVWLVAGWRKPRRLRSAQRAPGGDRLLAVVWMTLLVLAVGVIVISQATTGWIPGVRDIVEVAMTGTWSSLPATILSDWTRLGGRLAFWWAGVEAGTTAQDNLVFLALAGIVVWLVSALSAMLARRFRNGLAAAVPLLWLLSMILLYSREGRIQFVFALGLAVLLHFLTDHESMLDRWGERGLDYSPGLFLDRFMLVLGAALLILTLAAVMPNLYVQALVDRYYAEMQPVYKRMEDTAERLFPGVKGVSRLGGGLAGGLPNDFLLQAGPELTDAVVLHVRTSDTPAYDYPFDLYDDTMPAGHYMRGGTLTVYDGRGWRNPNTTERADVQANAPYVRGEQPGRKEVVQQVALTFPSQILYTVPEPVELSTGARMETRSDGDLVALWGREKTYTVVSYVPALSEDDLSAVPAWSDTNPLPEAMAIHLELPETVTERTVDLARELTGEQPNMYAQARAIETYLRGFEYDLTVAGPTDDVADVADYFLFDLQRGYCDYYATAFVVLARIAGLPARFATGFAPGSWNPEDGLWTVTEAEAHSWPEVYFPEYGWIPFEPTAGRSELVRVGLPSLAVSSGATPSSEPEPEAEQGIDWNWQMLVWLAPIGLLLWAGWNLLSSYRRRGEDPWQTLVRWGGRAGKPMATGETILEYGDGLADYVVRTQTERQDLARVAATEMRALSGAVSSGHYAPETDRERAGASVAEHWERLRTYLRALRRA